MKFLTFAGLALTLAACTGPLPVPGLKLDSGSVLVVNPTPFPLTGDPSRKGDGVALTVDGVNLVPDAVAAEWCKPSPVRPTTGDRWACTLPDVPPNQQLRVAFAGTVSDAWGWAYTPKSGPALIPLVRLP